MVQKTVTLTCEVCNRPFEAATYRQFTAVTCSVECRSARQLKPPNATCACCGVAFRQKPSQATRYARNLGAFCSVACLARFKSTAYFQERNPNWKGKNVDHDGYKIYVPAGPRATGARAIKLHQFVVFETLGISALLPGTHIHHRDCDILNNQPDNLAVLTISDHKWLHKQFGNATLWAYTKGRVTADELATWSDSPQRASRLLPISVLTQKELPVCSLDLWL